MRPLTHMSRMLESALNDPYLQRADCLLPELFGHSSTFVALLTTPVIELATRCRYLLGEDLATANLRWSLCRQIQFEFLQQYSVFLFWFGMPLQVKRTVVLCGDVDI